jgi:hypothetical protein
LLYRRLDDVGLERVSFVAGIARIQMNRSTGLGSRS